MKLTLSLEQIEANLDNGCLKAPFKTSAQGHSLWSVRRNGKTRTWKRDPLRFEIPVKIGFRHCTRIDNRTTFGTNDSYDFRVMT